MPIFLPTNVHQHQPINQMDTCRLTVAGEGWMFACEIRPLVMARILIQCVGALCNVLHVLLVVDVADEIKRSAKV